MQNAGMTDAFILKNAILVLQTADSKILRKALQWSLVRFQKARRIITHEIRE